VRVVHLWLKCQFLSKYNFHLPNLSIAYSTNYKPKQSIFNQSKLLQLKTKLGMMQEWTKNAQKQQPKTLNKKKKT